ncbi:MAG: hypothetical protein SFT91_02495 [Rickettsiaceae bacterium]|nr:hypothetical protein [Rickettsiaceae bacterium]
MQFVKEIIKSVYRKVRVKRLYFYITDLYLIVLYYNDNIFIDSCSVPVATAAKDPELLEFISRHKNVTAKFLINTKDVIQEKISMPSLGGFTQIDPIQNYCMTHIHKDHLCSYLVYSVNKEQSEIWKGVVCHTSINEKISQCFDILRENYIPYFGSYFYNIASTRVASAIATENKINLSNYIYTFTAILDENEILISINHNSNMLSSIRAEYPKGKSDEYVQGVIEQNISDLWIKYKTYVQREELMKVNIYLVNEDLKRLISNAKNNTDLYIFGETSEKLNPIHIFFKYFQSSKQIPATSLETRTYKRYRQFNSMFFQPFYFAFICVMAYMVSVKFQTYRYQEQASILYQEYNILSNKINDSKKNFAGVDNIIQFADLCHAHQKFTNENPRPFTDMRYYYNTLKSQFDITRLKWVNDDRSHLSIIDIKLNKTDAKNNLSKLENILEEFKQKRQNININLERLKIDQNNFEYDNALGIRVLISEKEAQK